MNHQQTPIPQKGAALIISLVLLAILTVLAVSTMRTASLGLLMAGNAQYRENAFQLAESGVANKFNQVTNNPAVLDAAPECPAPGDPLVATDPPVDIAELSGAYVTSVCHRGDAALALGSSIGRVSQLHYEIESRGTTEQRGAAARLSQGLYQLAPGKP